MKREDILACPGMPPMASSYRLPPFQFTDRAALSITYESNADAVRAALPEPLVPDGASVIVTFVDTTDSPFGAYRACAVSLAATFEETPVSYSHALIVDQEGPIYASREVWGFPATYGNPELIIGENRVAGVLDLGYGQHLRGSIPVAEESDPASVSFDGTQVTCKIIPGADGKPAIAQLVSTKPEAITIKHYWRGEAQLETGAGSPLAPFPVQKIISGQYVLADMTFPLGRVMHDYLQESK